MKEGLLLAICFLFGCACNGPSNNQDGGGIIENPLSVSKPSFTIHLEASCSEFDNLNSPVKLFLTFKNNGSEDIGLIPNRVELDSNLIIHAYKVGEDDPKHGVSMEDLPHGVMDYFYDDKQKHITLKKGEAHKIEIKLFDRKDGLLQLLSEASIKNEKGQYKIRAHFSGWPYTNHGNWTYEGLTNDELSQLLRGREVVSNEIVLKIK